MRAGEREGADWMTGSGSRTESRRLVRIDALGLRDAVALLRPNVALFLAVRGESGRKGEREGEEGQGEEEERPGEEEERHREREKRQERLKARTKRGIE